MTLLEQFKAVRAHTAAICAPLQTEDYVVQPVVDVSPPKWHLGHTTWFFETFVLVPYMPGYNVYNDEYNYVFNSYYETIGARVIRTDRGNLSRPSVAEVYAYRAYVDEQMTAFLAGDLGVDIRNVVTLGLNHEQQHCELLWTDIKYILGHNPLFPPYATDTIETARRHPAPAAVRHIDEGLYEIGARGDEAFCFDNELNRHKVYLEAYSIDTCLVTAGEYMRFMADGGYADHQHWHADGWEWLKTSGARAPMYWHLIDGQWHHYSLGGLQPVDLSAPVSHVSFYEASAFASWSKRRLPTEAEWEVASPGFEWGQRWEWTGSAYLPYPGFSKAAGAIGEYNGKFMINQMVLRGASIATPEGHSRPTYRNFFQPQLRWQFTGIRLVTDAANPGRRTA